MRLLPNAVALGFWLSTLAVSPPVAAAECSYKQIEPASTTREITNAEHRLRFEIPNNYRTALERYETGLRIAVRNPADVEFEACMSRPGSPEYSRYVETDVSISIYDLPSRIRNSDDLMDYVASLENINTENTFVEPITLGGQEGVFVIQKFSGNASRYPESNRYAFAIHPDGQHLIGIRAWHFGGGEVERVDTETQNLILSTLSFF
jgi:hypothetical protein